MPTDSSLPSPTPQNVASVAASLTNMLAMNDYIHSYGKDKFDEAFSAFSQQDNTDPGLIVGLNVIEGAFWAIGSEGGPAGNFAASFFSGILSAWATSPPDNINQSLLNFKVRFEETCGDVHQVVANYIADLQPSSTPAEVQAAWNGKVTFNGKDYVIGSLAEPQNVFPLPNTDSYNAMSAAALFSLKQSIWVYLLKLKYKVYTWTPNHNIVPGNPGTLPTGWMQSQYAKYPGRYYTAAWSPATKCRGAGWSMSEFTLGGYPSPYGDNAIPDSIAAPLFIDSTPGTTINPTGLYTRADVFTKLGLPTGNYTWAQPIIQAVDPEPAPEPATTPLGTEAPQPQHTVAYLRAMSEGKTLTQLIATEGREPLQARVVALAQQDPTFAYELQRRPYQTISHFLGVQIDPAIHLNVTVETEDTFGIVVPALVKPSS